MELTPEINDLLHECKILVRQGLEQLRSAGQIVTKLLDQHRCKHDDLAELLGTSLAIVDELDRIGRGTMYPGLYFACLPAKKAMLKISYSEQERLMNGGTIEMVTLKGDGGVDILQVDVKTLSRDQVKRVFAENRLLTTGEQRAKLIESQRKVSKESYPPTRKLPWEVTSRGDVQINFAQTIPKKQFALLAAQMGYTKKSN